MVFFWWRKKKKNPDKLAVYQVVWDTRSVKWLVKEEGEKNPVSTHHTKKEAVESGRKEAKKNKLSKLIVFKMDGLVETEYSFGDIASKG